MGDVTVRELLIGGLIVFGVFWIIQKLSDLNGKREQRKEQERQHALAIERRRAAERRG